jgi:membrane protease YdiL (CAAX protease family)
VLLLTLAAAAWLTRLLYTVPARSGRVLAYAYVLAAVLVAGSVLSGGPPVAHRRGRHPVVGPALLGLALFVFFLVAGAVLRWVPAVDHAVGSILARADRSVATVLALAVAGAAEELYYRGALFERVRAPVVTTALAHAAATAFAGNVALTLAALALGVACGLSRRTRGGWWAPAVTHVTWSLLMLWFTPR